MTGKVFFAGIPNVFSIHLYHTYKLQPTNFSQVITQMLLLPCSIAKKYAMSVMAASVAEFVTYPLDLTKTR